MIQEMANAHWVEAWIDVGGTFTDCLVKLPGGGVRRGKTLSSGTVPVSVQGLSSDHMLIPELAEDCEGFWRGASLLGLDETAAVVFSVKMEGSYPGGKVVLAEDCGVHRSPAVTFEIRCDLEAPVLIVHRLLQVPLQQSLPRITVRLGTTRGTNALLTRTGARTALLVTDPFQDLLAIGDQTRPDLFALDIVKPLELSVLNLPMDERLAADGSILRPLDVEKARSQLDHARREGCQSVAISLMHSYLNPAHERLLEELSRQTGFEQISSSNRVAPVIEYVARTQTTVVDAYLGPIVRDYLRTVFEQFGGGDHVRLEAMTSSGGLTDWQDFSGKDCILSGPAGGVVALGELRVALNRGPLIGLDMGGTSTDVCRIAGHAECEYESTKAGVRILTPTLPIETVAAGGGSICWFDGVSLRVGPHSAGAMPGPACYSRGGPLTITDLNVFSGRIPRSQFPFPLDLASIQNRIDDLIAQVAPVFGNWSPQQLVDGFRRLANQQMAEAVRTVSIRQGIDPREHFLVGFGGAAGQHICEIADGLGIRFILDHEDAGILSALGMGLAVAKKESVVAVYQSLETVNWDRVLETVDQVTRGLADQLRQPDVASKSLVTQLAAELRYQATDATLVFDFHRQSSEQLMEQFHSEHHQRYGHARFGHPIELVAMRISLCIAEKQQLPESKKCNRTVEPSQVGTLAGFGLSGGYPTIPRHQLSPGTCFRGPALVLNFGSTLTVEQGWQAEVLSDGSLWLERRIELDFAKHAQSVVTADASYDPVLRDCFAQRLSAIATQMGYVLQQTAVSVNVKRRRDYSCAVFDGDGRLLANAPHVPVHLGAMGQTVRSVISKFPHMESGDAFLCNDPFEGGSHLPDLTVIVPVFAPGENRPALFVANRAHHADVGGIAPGSMSILATKLGQEGMVISPFQLVQGGHSRMAELRQWVKGLEYPPRNWSDNELDLDAQQAACHRGGQLLSEYAQSIGWPAMRQYSQLLLKAGCQRVQQFIATGLPQLASYRNDSSCVQTALCFRDSLEDGTPIEVSLSRLERDRLKIDFSGTGTVSTSNLNANPSIVTAAVLYVLRCLIADELPLNEGVMEAIDLIIPESVLNPPAIVPRGQSPAVAAGNVETSQRVVDVLLGAFGVAAASQGTMNNLLFGNDRFGFYETICGGAGATRNRAGASAVHTHMTNTRLTDPEILEANYPVRLVEFRVREGSGGRGEYRGGNGVVRTFEFLQPVTLSLLSSRRRAGPFGLAGGENGLPGENALTDPHGKQIRLPASCQVHAPAGSRITIATPGGGGYGKPVS